MKESKPTIIRIVSEQNSAIESVQLTRHAIGYIKSGKRVIYEADRAVTISKGEVYYLARGTHYMESSREEHAPFEEVCFYYDEEDVQNIITNFEINFDLQITNSHTCLDCSSASHLRVEPWSALGNFFDSVAHALASTSYEHDQPGEHIKLSELIYIIVSHEDSCLKSRLIRSLDMVRAGFEQVIYANIFEPLSIDALAALCNRSLTSFKKEFNRIFDTPPHKWLLRQRLSRSRLLLIYSSESIAEIGVRCAFPNTSHFIKLFKRIYGDTPASFRAANSEGRDLDDRAANKKERAVVR